MTNNSAKQLETSKKTHYGNCIFWALCDVIGLLFAICLLSDSARTHTHTLAYVQFKWSITNFVFHKQHNMLPVELNHLAQSRMHETMRTHRMHSNKHTSVKNEIYLYAGGGVTSIGHEWSVYRLGVWHSASQWIQTYIRECIEWTNKWRIEWVRKYIRFVYRSLATWQILASRASLSKNGKNKTDIGKAYATWH